MAIAKMNDLIIHMIADLQLHVRHRGKVFLDLTLDLSLALALDLALDMALALALDMALAMDLAVIAASENPYFSRYGERWVEKLNSSSSMSKFCCITDLIRFMMKEAENLIKGSVHEDDFFIVSFAVINTRASWTIKKSSS